MSLKYTTRLNRVLDTLAEFQRIASFQARTCDRPYTQEQFETRLTNLEAAAQAHKEALQDFLGD